MASVKVTVTLPEDQLADIRRLVAEQQATSVSAFVQHAVALALDDAAGWHQTYEEIMDETGGPATAEEVAWADAILDGPGRTDTDRSVA